MHAQTGDESDDGAPPELQQVEDEQQQQQQQSEKEAGGQRKSDVRLVYVGGFLNYLSLALTVVALTLLVNRLVAGDAQDPNARAVLFVGIILLTDNAAQLVCVRTTAALSDHLGRKRLLIASSVAQGAARLGGALATSVYTLLALAAVDGALNCYLSVAQAWITDNVRRTERARCFALLVGLGVGAAFSVGIPVGSVLAEYVDLRLPFYLATGCHALNALLILYTPLRDLPPPAEGEPSPARAWPSDMHTFLHEHAPWSGVELIREAHVPQLWAIHFLVQSSLSTLKFTFFEFALKALRWTVPGAGLAFTAMGLAVAVAPRLLIRWLGESSALGVSLPMQAIGFVFFAAVGVFPASCLSCHTGLVVVGIVFISAGGSTFPCSQSLVSQQYAHDVQGKVQGLLGQLTVLSAAVGFAASVVLAVSISSHAAVENWPGACYLIGLGCLLAAWAVHTLLPEDLHPKLRPASTTLIEGAAASTNQQGQQTPASSASSSTTTELVLRKEREEQPEGATV